MRHDPSQMTNQEIIDRLVEISIRQGEAMELFETTKYNRLYKKNARLLQELRDRPGDGRHGLFPLYDHPNMQVKLNVARWTYTLDMPHARIALADIRDSRRFPYAGDAGMTLMLIDEGIGNLE
jgi:hypothetical protein